MSKPFQFSIRQALWVMVSLCVAVGLFAKMAANIEEARATVPKAPFGVGSASVGLLIAVFACRTWKGTAIVIALAAAMFVLAVLMLLCWPFFP